MGLIQQEIKQMNDLNARLSKIESQIKYLEDENNQLLQISANNSNRINDIDERVNKLNDWLDLIGKLFRRMIDL